MLQSRVAFLVFSIATLVYLTTTGSAYLIKSELDDNPTPIVGILTQEVSSFVKRTYPDRNLTSYIAASYVKFVEGAGARVVPIWIGESREYYEDILSKINGVILPGGATYFNQSNGYADAGDHIYDVALKLNQNGHFFPVLGVCLGFELLTYLAANKVEHRKDCSSNRQPLPLEFKKGYETSRLFRNAPAGIIDILSNQPVTANFHQYCVTEETFAELGLDKSWEVLSVNHDWNGFEFISSIEHKEYPFYGVQFHPEKNLYEFVRNRSIPHSFEAVRVAQFFADFFVSETRKNMNSFPDIKEEENSLIYNYSPEFTGREGSSYIQQYLFEGKSTARPKGNVNKCGEVTDKLNDIDDADKPVVLLVTNDELK